MVILIEERGTKGEEPGGISEVLCFACDSSYTTLPLSAHVPGPAFS